MLLKEVYGEAAFNKHNHGIQWEVQADRCLYAKTPEQGANECGFYALRIAYIYNGDKIGKNIIPIDVSNSSLFSEICM